MIGYERHGVGPLNPCRIAYCKCGSKIHYMLPYAAPELCEECEEKEKQAYDKEDGMGMP